VLQTCEGKSCEKRLWGWVLLWSCLWLCYLQTLIGQIQFLEAEQHEVHFGWVSILDMDRREEEMK
jgi:hypothetical protein